MSTDTETGTTIAALHQRLAELEAREERYRLAVESSRDGMWDWNVATGDVFYSPRWLEVLGYQPSDIEPNVSTFERLLHPDDAPFVMAALHAHMANQTTSYEAEFRLKTASGEWFWALDRGKVVDRDEQGQPLRVVGSFTNITERKHAEQIQKEELEKQLSTHQRELYRAQAALNQSGDAIYLTDSNGIIIYINRAVFTQLGYTPDELLGNTIDIIDHSYTQDDLDNILHMLAEHGTTTFETTHRRKDGSELPVEIQTSQVHLDDDIFSCAFVRDITERKQIEAEIAREKTFIEQALNSLQDVFYVLDTEGNIVRWNRRLKEVLGYTAEELKYMNALQFFTEEDHPPIIAAIQNVFTHGTTEVSSQFYTKRGVHMPYFFRGSHIVLDGQSFLVGLGMDMTEQIQAKHEREALQQEIIDAQQNAIRELSTPLLPIADHILTLPLIGTIDSGRALQIMEDLLEGISIHQASVAIVDITGIRVVDTQVAQAILQTAQATRLLGAQVVLTGIQPQIAQTLVQLGADMSGIITCSTLQAGIAYALESTT